jgi:hypothetical protein
MKVTHLFIAALITVSIPTLAPAHAADAPRFTLGVGGAFLRAQPSLSAALVGPVFGGQPYEVTARTTGNTWLQVTTLDGKRGWLLSSLGAAVGDVNSAPVAPAPAAPKTKTRAALPPVISGVTPQVKKLYRDVVKAGRSGGMFAVVGDCNSEPDAYWWRLSAGTFDASKHPTLAPVLEQFAWSFTRGSVAAKGGFNTASMFDTAWSDPAQCNPNETPLACELRRSNASIAFIALGTGDTHQWQSFEANYRRIVSETLAAKTVPVLVTKADDLESQESGAPPAYINDVVRKLGREFGVPVIDFWQATRTLPDFGMRWEGNENFHMRPEGSDLRILLTLHTLDAIAR